MNELQTRPRLLLLDRDGVLNQEAPGGYVLEPEQWCWHLGLPEALRPARKLGLRLCVVTNQSCIGRGLMTAAALDRVHERMRREAAAVGVSFAGIYTCPHGPREGCSCRKPKPGLVYAALTEQRVAPNSALMIGDALRDLEAASAAGVRAWLVRTGKGLLTEAERRQRGGGAVLAFDTLSDVLAAVARLPAPESL